MVPIAESPAGWVALEQRAQLGDLIPRLVLPDWIVADPPEDFLGALQALQSEGWGEVREALFGMWTEHAPENVRSYVRTYMAAYGAEMWQRAGREIARDYSRYGSPLERLQGSTPHVPVLHLFAQPEMYERQQQFAAQQPWFQPVHLTGVTSHFPAIEAPDRCAREILRFLQDR